MYLRLHDGDDEMICASCISELHSVLRTEISYVQEKNYSTDELRLQEMVAFLKFDLCDRLTSRV